MAKKKIMAKDISAGDVAVDPVVVDASVTDAPVVDVAAPEVADPVSVEEVVEPTPAPVAVAKFPVRAEITFNDGSSKTFSGASEDSHLDLSKIEVNG